MQSCARYVDLPKDIMNDRIQLKQLLTEPDRTRAEQLEIFALLNLGVLESLSHGLISAADALRTFFHAENCLYCGRTVDETGGHCCMVESGAKQFKARFCGPGMRWSRQGAENLLPVRATVLSGRFDQMGDAAKNLPPS